MIGSEAGFLTKPQKSKLKNQKPHQSENIDIEPIYYNLSSPKGLELINKIQQLEKELRSAKEELNLLIQHEQQNKIILPTSSVVSPQNDNFQGPYFYMYDLPEEFWWRWPKPSADCSNNGYLGHDHALLSGIGPPIQPDNGLFLTWHFSLFSSLFNRIKRSKRRTLDPEKAELFIIPYDLALDGYLNADNCNHRRSCSPHLVDKLRQELKKLPYFARNQGKDHAVLWSLGQYHPWPHNQCDVFMKDDCAQCTFTCYWMDPTKKDNRFVSIPFPSSYHWWDGITSIPWAFNQSHPRPLKVVYLGSTQTLNPHHTKIRRAMTQQCNASTSCHWMQIAHSSTDLSIGDFLSIYRQAVFCLCPPGDDPARKAVFDSILSGCIPVIFEVATLFNQYPWHLGEEKSLDISVSIPGGSVKAGKIDFMKVLLAIPEDTIRKKQIAISMLAHRIQYAIPPPDLLKDRFDATPWDPPFEDGVEILLNGLFQRSKDIRLNQSTHIPERLQTGREWGAEYDVIKIHTPQEGKYPEFQAIRNPADLLRVIAGISPSNQSQEATASHLISSSSSSTSYLPTSSSIQTSSSSSSPPIDHSSSTTTPPAISSSSSASSSSSSSSSSSFSTSSSTSPSSNEIEKEEKGKRWSDWEGWGKLSKNHKERGSN